jgi:transposase
VTRQSIYNWIRAYEATKDSKALSDAVRTGRPRLWTAEKQALLRVLLETTPDRFGYVAVSWTVSLLREQIERTTGSPISEITVRRALHQEQYVWKRPRYVLEPDPDREKKEEKRKIHRIVRRLPPDVALLVEVGRR